MEKQMVVSSSASNPRLSAADEEEISIFDAQRYFNESNIDATRVCKRVSPLNMPNVNIDALPRFSSASSSAATDHGYVNGRVRSFHATPTASSEASWNSKTGLLSNPPGAIAVSMSTMKNHANGDHKRKGSSSATASATGKTKWLTWRRRRCPCPCSDEKSIQVEPKTPRTALTNYSNQKLKAAAAETENNRKSSTFSVGDEREERIPAVKNNQFLSAKTEPPKPLKMITDFSGVSAGFTFPILKMGENLEDPARDSLEVFRPRSDDHHQSLSSNIISVPKKVFSRLINTNINSTLTDQDDVGSDTSSDLFEIESFSTATTTSYPVTIPLQQRRDSLDEAAASSFNNNITRRSILAAGELAAINNNNNNNNNGSYYSPIMMMRDCYEPSEASIEWSVTTADGFERGSVGVSEAEEMMGNAAHSNGGGGKKKTGGLLSCRSEKAVSVVGPNSVTVLPRVEAATPTPSKHVMWAT